MITKPGAQNSTKGELVNVMTTFNDVHVSIFTAPFVEFKFYFIASTLILRN